MKTLIISNIPDAMFAHMVNGFAGRGDAHLTLSEEEQKELVADKLIEHATGVAKSHAVNMAQLAAGRATAQLADTLIAQTRAEVQVSVEEASSP